MDLDRQRPSRGHREVSSMTRLPAAPRERVRVPDELRGCVIPRHIAIIMDGNGRWARRKALRRLYGHRTGAETVRQITRACARMGVARLTLYAWSYENWSRPKAEVAALMGLLRRYLVGERDEIMQNNIRFTAVGRLEDLPEDVLKEYHVTRSMSQHNTGMVLSLALSYSARLEIVDAVRRIVADVKRGLINSKLLEERDFARYLYDPEAPDPDLLIRTGGELRLSNFLLWQLSYTELWVTDVMWPDFAVRHLYEAIRSFSRRERRFGGVEPP
jgi:undecaprenyl diphosphate synthase